MLFPTKSDILVGGDIVKRQKFGYIKYYLYICSDKILLLFQP